MTNNRHDIVEILLKMTNNRHDIAEIVKHHNSSPNDK